jgi:hypothetical protein
MEENITIPQSALFAGKISNQVVNGLIVWSQPKNTFRTQYPDYIERNTKPLLMSGRSSALFVVLRGAR